MPLRVIIGDDDEGVRTALASLIDSDERCEIVALVGTGPDAVQAVKTHAPDVAVLDLHMPGGGVEAAQAIRQVGGRTTVVVVSARIDRGTVERLLDAGVRGVFVKGSVGADLPELIAHCCGGHVLLATPVAADAVLGVRRRRSGSAP